MKPVYPRRALSALAIVAIVAIGSMPLATAGSSSECGAVDCSFLLVEALNIVTISLENRTKAISMARTMLQVRLPSDIEDSHSRFYESLLTYLQTLEGLEEKSPQDVLANLSKAYVDLYESYKYYSGRLIRCSHDLQVASTAAIKTRLTITRIILPSIERMVYEILEEQKDPRINIVSSENTYLPGETALFRIDTGNSNLADPRVVIVEWPTLRPISYYRLAENASVMTAIFRVPYAYKLKDIVSEETIVKHRIIRLALLFTAKEEDTGRRVFSFKLFNVTYNVPRIYIKVPKAITYGETLRLVIISDEEYPNVTITLNGDVYYEGGLSTGSNEFHVDTLKINRTSGNIIHIVIKIHPGTVNVGADYEKVVLLEGKDRGIRLYVSNIILTWSGWVEIPLRLPVNTENATVEERVFAIKIRQRCINNSGASLRFFASLLPLTPLELKITAQVKRGGTVVAESSEQKVLVVNPLYTLAVAAIALLLASTGLPTGYVVLASTGSQWMEPGGKRRSYRIVYTIASRAAEMYYRLLKLLRIEPPRPAETLREHLRRTLGTNPVARGLYRILRLVEEDLYSPRRVKIEMIEAIISDFLRSIKRGKGGRL